MSSVDLPARSPRKLRCPGLVALAVLLGGCQRRPACTALQPRPEQEATDAEYMPGYTPERIAAEATNGPSEMDGPEESVLLRAGMALRLEGEAPLLRLAGNGDGARCMQAQHDYTAVGRMLHTPNMTRHYVQRMGRCEPGPGRRLVGRRYERTIDGRSWAEVDRCLRESGFDGKSIDAETHGVLDADWFFLEAVRGGRYHAVEIDDVSREPDSKPRPIDCCRLLLGS